MTPLAFEQTIVGLMFVSLIGLVYAVLRSYKKLANDEMCELKDLAREGIEEMRKLTSEVAQMKTVLEERLPRG